MTVNIHCFLFILDTGHSLEVEIKSYNLIEFWDRLIVIIYGAYPLLISKDNLIKRIDFYHNNNVLVSTRSILTEYASRGNVFEKFVEESKIAGFDIIEISENNVNIFSKEKEKLVKVLDS